MHNQNLPIHNICNQLNSSHTRVLWAEHAQVGSALVRRELLPVRVDANCSVLSWC